MGFDILWYSFIGSKLEFGIVVVFKRNVFILKRFEGVMEGFFVKVIDVLKYYLFDLEEYFQGIRFMMIERMFQDLERFKVRVLEMVKVVVSYFFEMNFLGSEIIVMEGFFISFNDRVVEIVVVVVWYLNKMEKDIICVVYCILSFDGELYIDVLGKRKEWLGILEVKVGLVKLLEKMQQWQKEGRFMEGECMVQLMIGIDVDFYEFVDGCFEELSEECIV